jgi:hypothetical protein
MDEMKADPLSDSTALCRRGHRAEISGDQWEPTVFHDGFKRGYYLSNPSAERKF